MEEHEYQEPLSEASEAARQRDLDGRIIQYGKVLASFRAPNPAYDKKVARMNNPLNLRRKQPGMNEEWCKACTGSGQQSLPSNITGPNTVDLVYRFKQCDVCSGTGIVRKG